MLNIDSIDTTIEYYENQETTLENCRLLADLYICKDHYTGRADYTNNITQAYRMYIDSKKEFQLNKTDSITVLDNLDVVLNNIHNLLNTMFQGVDTQEERERMLIFKEKLEKTLYNS